MGVVERQAPFLIETILQEKDMEFEVNRLLSPYLYNDILSSIKRTDFSAFTGKTVLITGASKPLGYYLACALLINNDLNSEGAKIIAVDSSDKLMEKFGKLTYRGDIDFVVTRDYSYLGGERADIVIHTEDITELEPFTASLNLLRFITSNRAKAAICVPCSVYGEVFNGRDTLGESDLFGYNDCTDPEKSHIQYNRMLITETLKLAREKGFDVKVPIIADVVSAFDCRYSELLRAAALNKNIIAEQGDFPASAIYVSDAAAAVVKALFTAKSGELINISADYTLCEKELAKLLSNLYGDAAKVHYKGQEKSLSPMSKNLYVLDNTRLRRLGYIPDATAEAGVTRALNIITEKGGEA